MIAVIRLPRLAGDNIPTMANTEKKKKKWKDFTMWQVMLCPWCIHNVTCLKIKVSKNKIYYCSIQLSE